MRDELDLQDRTLIGLAVMATGAVALFGYQIAVLVGHLPPGLGLWGKLFGLFLLVLIVQILLVRLAGRMFQADGGLSEYLYTLLLLHVVLGVALLPITASIAWPHDVTTAAARPDEMLWRVWGLRLGAGLVALVTVFRWLRAAVLGLGEGVPLRYVFIYLCALEILPVALACQQALRYLPDPSHPL